MWVLRKLIAPRASYGRYIAMLTITLLMATFLSVASANNTYAAEAVWNGKALVYEEKTYTEVPKEGLPNDDTKETVPYAWVDTAENPQQAHVIFIPSGAEGIAGLFDRNDEFSAGQATLKIFDYQPPSTYTPTSQPVVKVDIVRDLTAESPTDGPSCVGTGNSLDWLICPITNGLSKMVDTIYAIIRDYLEVNRLSLDTSRENGMYSIWSLMRSVANVAFVIVFLLIIYSQMMAGTGGGIDAKSGLSNYTVKRVLPKLIIAAILVNISYLICALAIDASNLLGHSIRVVFDNIRDNYIVNLQGVDITWGDVSTWILSGGAIAGGAVAYLNLSAAAVGGMSGLAAFGYLLLTILIPAAISLAVAFIVLFARQAIITVMVLMAPLAFVALVLPSTSGLFTKWRKSFTSLLVFFPMFAILFGASQLAGSVILSSANGKIHILLMGMAVQIIPLFVTPWMLKFSNGLLGEVAKMVNSSSSGIKKAGKDWAKDRQDYHRSEASRKMAQRIAEGNASKANPLNWSGRTAHALDQSKRKRENRKKMTEELLSAEADKRHEEDLSDRDDVARPRTALGRRARSARHQAKALTYSTQKQAEFYKNRSSAENERKWEEYLSGNTVDGIENDKDREKERQDVDRYRSLLTDERVDKGIAGIHQERMQSDDENTLQTLVHGDSGLRRVIKEGISSKKTAEMQKNITQKEGEAEWEARTATDDGLKSLRLSETAATDSHRHATAEWNKIIEDVRLKGTSSTHATAGAATDTTTRLRMSSAADTMKKQTELSIVTEKATGDLKASYESASETQYITSAEGQALSRSANAYKDILAGEQAKETAIVQEWRTEKGAEDLTGQDAETARQLRDADIIKKSYSRRNEMASDISNQEYAKLVMDDEIIPGGTEEVAVVAGGIAGRAGISQAKATAKQTVFAAAGKAVEAEKTLLSQIKEDDILSEEVAGEPGLASANILDEPAERLSAMTSSIASRYHMASHIKLWERVGELQRESMAGLEAAKQSGDSAQIKNAEDKVAKVKDMQQQLMKDKTKTPFGIGDVDQGDATVGTYTDNIYVTSRKRIHTHLSAKKISSMDPDDLKLLMELAKNNKLNQKELELITQAYDEWANDDILKSSLETKHRLILDPIKKQAQTGVADYPDTNQYGTEINAIDWSKYNFPS